MKLGLFLILCFILSACYKPILIERFITDNSGYYFYGNSNPRSFFYDIEISDRLEVDFVSDTRGSAGDNSVLFVKDQFIVADKSAHIYAFADSTGKQLGRLNHKGEIAISPVVAGDILVYAVNELRENYATMYFYNFKMSDYITELTINGNCQNEIILHNDFIHLITQDGNYYKISSRGKIMEELNLSYTTYSDPFLVNERIYFAAVTGEILELDIEKNELNEIITIDDEFRSSLIIKDNNCYISGSSGVFYSISIKNKTINWVNDGIGKATAEPVIDNYGYIYVSTLSGELYKLKWENGKEVWHYSSNGVFTTPPLVFKNLLFQSDLNKRLVLISTNDGEMLTEYNYDKRLLTAPTYFNKKLYLPIDRGEIIRYSVSVK
jgi:outer membrane protein assembly factor BamB